MPTISLRLTEEEHAALKEWAHGSHRSMQREAVYRIFSPVIETDAPEDIIGILAHKQPIIRDARALPPESAVRTFGDREAKSDFKR